MSREKERVKHEGQDGAEIEKKMFQFSKQRVKEIEHQVRELYFHDKKLENPSCTKLNNVSAQSDFHKMQKEMLDGNYKIQIDQN